MAGSTKHSRAELAEALGQVWHELDVPLTVEELAETIGAPAKNVTSVIKKLVADSVVEKLSARIPRDGAIKKVPVFAPSSSSSTAASPSNTLLEKKVASLARDLALLQDEVKALQASAKDAGPPPKRSAVESRQLANITATLELANRWHQSITAIIDDFRGTFDVGPDAVRQFLGFDREPGMLEVLGLGEVLGDD